MDGGSGPPLPFPPSRFGSGRRCARHSPPTLGVLLRAEGLPLCHHSRGGAAAGPGRSGGQPAGSHGRPTAHQWHDLGSLRPRTNPYLPHVHRAPHGHRRPPQRLRYHLCGGRPGGCLEDHRRRHQLDAPYRRPVLPGHGIHRHRSREPRDRLRRYRRAAFLGKQLLRVRRPSLRRWRGHLDPTGSRGLRPGGCLQRPDLQNRPGSRYGGCRGGDHGARGQ
jgi:hypothetical protein